MCCTEHRRALLANDEVHKAFVEFAVRAEKDFNIAVGRYVIMPDHLHFFVGGPDDFVLSRWFGTLKRCLALGAKPKTASPFRQRGFFDHVLRSKESYSQK